MAEPKVPPPGALVSAVMVGADAPWEEVLDALSQEWGKVAMEGPGYPFIHSSYYQEEMGVELEKRFYLWSKPLPQDGLPKAKLFSNSVERRFSRPDGTRRVNVDPGLLTLHSLVLATAKGYSHRVYLGEGIFAEVTLLFRDGEFRPLPWTYPDYAQEEVRRFMMRARGWLKRRLYEHDWR